MSEQTQEEYGDNGIRLSAAELFKRWKRAVEHGEDNLKIGMTWMDEASRLARRNALLVAEIETVRAERDEARREVCVLMQQTGFLRGDYAIERGWDCFRETS